MFKHTGTDLLQTERLLLRKFNYSDAGDMFKNWISDPIVQQNYGEQVYGSEGAVLKLLEKWIPQYSDKGFYRWAIIHNETGKNIGQIAFCKVYDEFETAELEYCIGQNFWGRGYTAEALKKVLNYSFNIPEFLKLEAFHRITNPNSGRVLQKSGMKIVSNVKRFELINEQPCNEVCYALTRDVYFKGAS